MRICLALKGTYSVNEIREGSDTSEKYKTNCMKSFDSIQEALVQPFLNDGHTVDIFCSSYDTSIASTIESYFKPKRFFKFPRDQIDNGGDWNRQLLHYMKLFEEIIYYVSTNQMPMYDFFIFGRFDLLYKGTFKDWNIDMDKFNIPAKHSSGNCDDNIWILPGQYISQFAEAIYTIYERQNTTHTLNHRLTELNVPIHYIYELTEEDYKNDTLYKIFSFNRKG